jgi:Amt family ammonium transporter
LLIQFYGVAATIAWSAIGTLVILKLVNVLTPLRVTREHEIMGLDVALHGEAMQ